MRQPGRAERLAAAHARERRGWSPDAERLGRVLDDLAAAITARGGQRRARPHLDAQRRRLANRRRDAA